MGPFCTVQKISGLLALLLVSTLFSFAQSDSTNMVEYTPDFKFKEGVYINFNQVQNNDPLPKSRIVATIDYDDPEFFDKILDQKSVYYYDNIGNREELKTNKIWGYSRNGFLYIKMDDGFFRITMIGAVCHFVASETTYSSYYNSPYAYGGYYDPYRSYPSSYPTTEMRQYLLDFKTGRVMDYTEEALDVIFMQDPKIQEEYSSLSNRKRKQMKFVYMRKYNEQNPLYFPKN